MSEAVFDNGDEDYGVNFIYRYEKTISPRNSGTPNSLGPRQLTKERAAGNT